MKTTEIKRKIQNSLFLKPEEKIQWGKSIDTMNDEEIVELLKTLETENEAIQRAALNNAKSGNEDNFNNIKHLKQKVGSKVLQKKETANSNKEDIEAENILNSIENS